MLTRQAQTTQRLGPALLKVCHYLPAAGIEAMVLAVIF
jgi:hypothetical protein